METKAEAGQSRGQGSLGVQQIMLGVLFGTRGHLQLPLTVKQEEHLDTRACWEGQWHRRESVSVTI